MSKKLQGNGIWEASRMMLPQHKERINKHRVELGVKTKPILHSDEIEEISQTLSMSLKYGKEVSIEIFGAYENRKVTGVVSSISEISGRLKVNIENGYEFVDFDEIVSVSLFESSESLEMYGY